MTLSIGWVSISIFKLITVMHILNVVLTDSVAALQETEELLTWSKKTFSLTW